MLAEALAALTSTGATALVTAMVTDGWEGTRARFARLLGRGDDKQTDAAGERLDHSHAVLAAVSGPDLRQAQAEQEIVWRTRLSDLLEQEPGAEPELRALISEIQAQVIGSAGRVEQHATASGHAQQAVQGHGVQNVTFSGHDGPHTSGQ